MKKPLRIGAYIRVSTDRQVQVFEGSLETQKYRMQEFVKNKNKENKKWGQIVEIYPEEGFSAGTSKRPQYQRMMADMRSGHINLILVSDISRLSRSVHDFSVLLKQLEKYNASFLSMKEEQFDTTTPSGRLMINLVVNMAQFEREQTSERVSINFNSRAMRGLVNGGRAPFGFDKHPEKKGIHVINEKEAEDVRAIFKILCDQGSIGKTLHVLEAQGIYPKATKKNIKEGASRKWTYTLLRDILVNPAYIGLREVNKHNRGVDSDALKPWQKYQMVKAAWPAIVDQQLFEEVQKILEESQASERRRLENSERRIFLLTNILHCGECGRPLCGQSSHGANEVHRYYAHSYKRNQIQSCSLKRIRADDIEEAVVAHFSLIARKAGYFDTIEEKLNESFQISPENILAQISAMRVRLTDVEAEIASTFKVQINASTASQTAILAYEHLEKLGNQKLVLMDRIAELDAAKVNMADSKFIRQDIEERVRRFQKGFPKATPATRRRLLKRVLKSLVLTEKGIEVFFHVHESVSDLMVPEAGKVLEFKGKSNPRPPLGELTDSVVSNLLIDGIGWGTRTRT